MSLSATTLRVALACALATTPALACHRVTASSAPDGAPARVDDGWALGSLETAAIDRDAMVALTRQLETRRDHRIDALVIARGGELVYEGYFRGTSRDTLHDLRSATKSITSLLAGVAFTRGELSLATPVWSALGRTLPAADPRARVTVESLLTMGSGLECDDRDRRSPGNEERMYRRRDWLRFFLALPSARPPGARGVYCTAGVVALGAVLERSTRTPVPEYARRHLFEPLEIRDASWASYDRGRGTDTGGHLRLRARDLAKFGQLILSAGEWRGARVVARAWIEQATRAHARVDGADYGYLWWLNELPVRAADGPTRYRVVYAAGNGGQFVFVLPELELVVATTGRAYNSPRAAAPLEILRHVIAPAVTPRARGS
ncbi:MAG: serine hydrolase [Myxococcales bacterium]|nr:serine hydrolase [Myxococcales bacterium]